MRLYRTTERVHDDNPAWVCCCCGCLPILGLFKALLFSAPPTLYCTVAMTGTAILFFPHDVYSVIKLTYTTVVLGRNLRLLLLLLLPFAFMVWLPLVFVCSLMGSFLGSFFFLAATVFDDDKPLLTGGVRDCYKYTHDAVKEFWKFNWEVNYEFVENHAFIPVGYDGQFFEIPIAKVFIGIFLAFYGSIVGLIMSTLIAVIKFFPLLLKANYLYLKEPTEVYLLLFWIIGWGLMNALSPLFIVVVALFGLGCGVGCVVDGLQKDSIPAGLWSVLHWMRDFDIATSEFILGDGSKPGSCIPDTPASLRDGGDSILTGIDDAAEALLERVYSCFLRRCRSIARRAVEDSWIKQGNCTDLEPFVLLGVPAATLFTVLVEDNANMTNYENIGCSDMTIKHSDLSRNNGIVRIFWPKIMSIRRHINGLKLSPEDKEYVRFHLISGGAPDSELTEQARLKKTAFENDKSRNKVKLNGLVSQLNSFAIDVSRLKFMVDRFSKEGLFVDV